MYLYFALKVRLAFKTHLTGKFADNECVKLSRYCCYETLSMLENYTSLYTPDLICNLLTIAIQI